MSDFVGPSKGLDARLEGSEVFTVAANSAVTSYVNFSFDCDFNGIEFYSNTTDIGDKLDLHTEYYAGGPWLRYKKFGKNWNIVPSILSRIILFPTSPKVGVRLALTYTNNTDVEVKYFVNKFQFINSETVNLAIGGQGEDW